MRVPVANVLASSRISATIQNLCPLWTTRPRAGKAGPMIVTWRTTDAAAARIARTRGPAVALLFHLLLAGSAGSASPASVAGFFSGDLDGRIPVTLSLAQDGERVHGILVYQRIGNDIAIDGQITPDGALTLTETGVAGKRTGQWALRLSQPVESQLSPGLVGRWNDPSGGRDRAVRLDRWTPLAAEPVAYAPISAGESLGREQASGPIA